MPKKTKVKKPCPDFQRMTLPQIRRFTYDNNLGMVVNNALNRPIRHCSRKEMADALEEIFREL